LAPHLAPCSGDPAVIGLHISGFADRSLNSRTHAAAVSCARTIAAFSAMLPALPLARGTSPGQREPSGSSAHPATLTPVHPGCGDR
jgi:hypothetical protein